ncbi:RNA helicase, partial [Escherichia coli]
EQMNRADKLDNKKKNTVGFALTQLQRRLASSPEAIYQSLKRRRNRLKDKLAEMKLLARGQKAKQTGVAETLGSYTVTKQLDLPDNWDELDEDLSAEEYELYAEQVTDQATAAETILELDAEIESLK